MCSQRVRLDPCSRRSKLRNVSFDQIDQLALLFGRTTLPERFPEKTNVDKCQGMSTTLDGALIGVRSEMNRDCATVAHAILTNFQIVPKMRCRTWMRRERAREVKISRVCPCWRSWLFFDQIR